MDTTSRQVFPADTEGTPVDDQGRAYFPPDTPGTLVDEQGRQYFPADTPGELVESSRSIKRAGLVDERSALQQRGAELDKLIPPRKEDPLVPVAPAWDELFSRTNTPATPVGATAEQQDRSRIGVAHSDVTLGDTSAKPMLDLGRMPISGDESKGQRLLKSAVNSINEGVEGFTSQQGVEGMMMAGPVARFAFGTLGAIGTAKAALMAAKSDTPEELGRSLGSMLLNAAQTALLARGKAGEPAAPSRETRPVSQTEPIVPETPTAVPEPAAIVPETPPNVPPPELPANTEVTLKAKTVAGEELSVKMDAREADAMLTKRKSAYEALLDCLHGL